MRFLQGKKPIPITWNILSAYDRLFEKQSWNYTQVDLIYQWDIVSPISTMCTVLRSLTSVTKAIPVNYTYT